MRLGFMVSVIDSTHLQGRKAEFMKCSQVFHMTDIFLQGKHVIMNLQGNTYSSFLHIDIFSVQAPRSIGIIIIIRSGALFLPFFRADFTCFARNTSKPLKIRQHPCDDIFHSAHLQGCMTVNQWCRLFHAFHERRFPMAANTVSRIAKVRSL